MTDELSELHEHAEHAQHKPELAPVSLTMAILAVLVAVASLLGHRAHTEEVVLQAKSSDQWAFYQAKNIRKHNDEIFVDLASIASMSGDAATLEKVREKYSKEAERYEKEQEKIKEDAEKLQEEVGIERRRADYYDLAEVFLEIGLVVTSITLLSGKKMFWFLGMAMAVIGFVVATRGFLVH